MPMMPFIGVRISWLMLARNSLLARLAASAASRGAAAVLLRPLPLGHVPEDRLRPDHRAPGVDTGALSTCT